MLINEHRGIENAPFQHCQEPISLLALFSAYQKNAFPVMIVNFCDRDLWEHALNYSQKVVSDPNKHFKFDLDRKLNP